MSQKTIILLLLFSMAFAPSLRSCGHISYGFPVVAIEAKNPVAIEKIKPVNALINIIVIVVIFFMLKKIMLNDQFYRVFKDGLKGIHLYQLILFFSYLVIYWCIQISDKFLMMIYVLYPFSSSLLNLDNPLLANFSENSQFFGDEFDIAVRLNYLCSLLLWFFTAIILSRIKNIYIEKKRKNH